MKRQKIGKSASFQPELSRFAVTVLKKLGSGRKARMGDSGDAMQGSVRIPESVVKLLRSRDLVQVEAGFLALTDRGTLYLRRAEKSHRSALPGREAVDPYRCQHMRLAQERRSMSDGKISKVLVNKAESPIGWLMKRKGRDGRPLIDQEQYEAGERLREDYERAGMGAHVTMTYDGVPVSRAGRGGVSASGSAHISDGRIDAGRRVAAAVEAMGPGLADIAIRICCHLEGLEAAEKALGWPSRSAKLVLSLALDRLVDFYDGKSIKKRTPEGVRQGEGLSISP